MVEVQSGAVEAVLAELDRLRRIESVARIYIQHWNAVDDWKIVREYELRRDLARELEQAGEMAEEIMRLRGEEE
jgi:hypothetical protein